MSGLSNVLDYANNVALSVKGSLGSRPSTADSVIVTENGGMIDSVKDTSNDIRLMFIGVSRSLGSRGARIARNRKVRVSSVDQPFI